MKFWKNKGFLSFSSSLDFFHSPVTFYLDGRTKRSSGIGIFFSLIIIGLMTVQFVSSDFFGRKSPSVILETQHNEYARRIEFTSQNPIFFTIGNMSFSNFKPIIDPTLFSPMVILYENWVPRMVPIAPCQPEDLPFSQSFFESFNIQKAWCLQEKNISLVGNGDDLNFTMMHILVMPCNNLTMNGTCKPIETINAFFDNAYFYVGYFTAYFNPQNYDRPFLLNLEEVTSYLDHSLNKFNYVYLKMGDMITDTGWIFSEPHKESKMMTDKNLPDFRMRKDLMGDPLVTWMFVASRDQNNCFRRYQRLPEILASMIGLLQIEIMIGSLITYFAVHISTMKNILNQLYRFEVIPPESVRISQLNASSRSRKSTQQIKSHFTLPLTQTFSNQIEFPKKAKHSLDQNKPTMEFNTTPNKVSQRSKKIPEPKSILPPDLPIEATESSMLNHNLNFSLREYFKFLLKRFLFLRLSKKEKMILKGEKHYLKDLDVAKMLTYLKEIERLKMVMLDKDQILLFDLINKTFIGADDRGRKIKEKHRSSFLEAYQRCKENQNPTNIDQKLLELCEKNIVLDPKIKSNISK